MDQNKMVIDAQARIISKYRADFDRLNVEVDELRRDLDEAQCQASFYQQIQSYLQEHETLRPIWEELVATMKLLEVEFHRPKDARKDFL